MVFFDYIKAFRILVVFGILWACGKEESKKPLSRQERFEAVYGYSSCKDAVIGTTLTQPTWTTVFHTYYNGYLEQTDAIYLDESCKTPFITLNRWASFKILDSSNEESGEYRLAITTERILRSVDENVESNEPRFNCNRGSAEDIKKEECKPYLDVTRYVTVKLTGEGYQPFKDIDAAGTTEETISTELAPYVLKVLDAVDP